MKPGDLVKWNYGKHRLTGVILKKSGYFGWEVYFSKINKINHMEASALKKIQQLTEEK
jgi:predicted negative regulator of RcsB-dependent stress response